MAWLQGVAVGWTPAPATLSAPSTSFRTAAVQQDDALLMGSNRCGGSGVTVAGLGVLAGVGVSWCEARRSAHRSRRMPCGRGEPPVVLGPMRFEGSKAPEGATLASMGLKLSIPTLQAKARSGSPLAQFELAREYLSGERVDESASEAAKWFEKAAEQGVAEAQYNFGQMCWEGDGVPKDRLKAIYWLGQAAEQGVAYAQLLIGNMMLDGDGVPRDVEKGLEYLQGAAGQGLAKEVAPCISEAAGKGSAIAQNMMGTMLYFGDGVDQNKEWAAYWFEESAKQRLPEAQYNLGLMLQSGDGIPENKEWSRYWLGQAAENGNAAALKALKDMS